jgi:hypothetical protein
MKARFPQFVIVGLSLLIATLALAQEKPQGTKLTGAELTQLLTPSVILVGRSMTFGRTFANAYFLGGNLLQVHVTSQGGGDQMRGKWRVSGDTLCTTFPLQLVSEQQCGNFYKLGGSSYEAWSVPEGKFIAKFRAVRPD